MGRPVAVPQRDARFGPNWSAVYDIAGGRPKVSGRPAHQADMAQARLFIELLQDEMTQLEALAAGIQARGTDPAEQRRRKDVHRLNPRLNEVRQLLDALWDRFPAL